jgi:hypothetical protein
MASRIRIRRGTTTQWNSSTKILESGELGIDTTLNKVKAGNGINIWSALPYLTPPVAEVQEMAQDGVAAALSAGTHSNILVSYDDTNNSISLSTGPDVVTTTSLSTTLTDSTTGYVPYGDIGQPDGVASLDSNGKVPDSEIPATIARDTEIPSSTSSLSEGTNLYFTDERAQDAVGNSLGSGLSYNDTTGAISVDTSVISTKTYADTTATAAATTVFNNILDSAPTALNTLNELAAAINDDQNFATTVTTALGTKLSITTATSDYLKITDAASTYLAQTAATATYLDKTQPALDYQIFNSGTGGYIVNGVLNGPITLTPGKPARISIQAPGHPLWFQTSYGAYDQANVYDTGIEGSGTQTGQIVILLPLNAPQLYYACQFHESMKGVVLFEKDSSLQTFAAKTGSYAPVLMDMGKIIEMSGGGTFTITDSASFPVGTTFEVLQTGSSQVTIAGDGFTINATPGLKLRTQWSAATIIKRGTNSWVAFGDLVA